MQRTCPDCGNRDYRVYGDSHYTYYKCNKCGGIWDDFLEDDFGEIKVRGKFKPSNNMDE